MTFELQAQVRSEQGTGASRRLRRAGAVPAIIYGKGEPVAVTLDHNAVYYALQDTEFHRNDVTITVDGKQETVRVQAVQWHAFKPQVLHVDFSRA